VNTAGLVSFDHAARARGLWDPDNLHFTAAGSREFGSKLAPIVAAHLQGQLPESNASSQQPMVPETTNVRTDPTITKDTEVLRPSTPERKNAIVRIDCATSADWNHGIQTMKRPRLLRDTSHSNCRVQAFVTQGRSGAQGLLTPRFSALIA